MPLYLDLLMHHALCMQVELLYSTDLKIALHDGKALLTGIGSRTISLTNAAAVMQADKCGSLLDCSVVQDTGARDDTRCGVLQVPGLEQQTDRPKVGGDG